MSINEEVIARVAEINRVSEQTQFNGVKVLTGGTTNISIQVGAFDNETIDIKLGTVNSTTLFAGGSGNLGAITEGTDAKATAGAGILSSYAGATGGTAATAKVSTDLLADIDAAISKVDSQRSGLGAIQNRFESTVANLNNTVTNLTASRSRIEDADYAVEVSNMTRAQILQQAGTAVLAQANQVPQTMLSLLR